MQSVCAATVGTRPANWDAYECNNTNEQVSDLYSYRQNIINLTIFPHGDMDWYTWTAANDGDVTIGVSEITVRSTSRSLRMEIPLVRETQ